MRWNALEEDEMVVIALQQRILFRACAAQQRFTHTATAALDFQSLRPGFAVHPRVRVT